MSNKKLVFPPCEKCGKELIAGDTLHCPVCDAKAEQELIEKMKRVKSCRKCIYVGECTCMGITSFTRPIGEVLDERDPNRYQCTLLKVRVQNPLEPACHGESFIFQDSEDLRREYKKREE
jgi:hypothetical protein